MYATLPALMSLSLLTAIPAEARGLMGMMFTPYQAMGFGAGQQINT